MRLTCSTGNPACDCSSFRQVALMIRRKMNEDDKSEAAVWRDVFQKCLECSAPPPMLRFRQRWDAAAMTVQGS